MRGTRIRINPYNYSNSAKLLSDYLCILKLKIHNSKFRGTSEDIIINWGMGKGNIRDARQINNLQNVQLASNKRDTLMKLSLADISVPTFYTQLPEEDGIYVARTTLTGHSGEGIVIGTPNELPYAPLYTKFIYKVAEYRVIVVGNKVVDIKQKKKKRDVSHHPEVWNHKGGYIFARNDIDIPDGLKELGIKAVDILGLDFGAVDIIQDADGVLYVLEVNTAFGMEGMTLPLVGDAISELIRRMDE